MTKPLYDITQCTLYKLRSKARLAEILHLSVKALSGISKKPEYREFLLPKEVCEFTGKTKSARPVQVPEGALRSIHDRLHDLLQRCKPPAYAHAAVKGRSYKTNAEAHKNGATASTFDLKNFYGSTSGHAVFLFFLDQMRCTPDIASLLARLVCITRGDSSYLPTGSPLSTLLSVYVNKPMFDKLQGLAKRYDLTFTCYVDDLTFSGPTIPQHFEQLVSSQLKRYWHNLADNKTRHFSVADQKHITGVVISDGKVKAPYSRFHKARKIKEAITSTPNRQKKIDLTKKLVGLIGEAASLDPRYKGMLDKERASLKALVNNIC